MIDQKSTTAGDRTSFDELHRNKDFMTQAKMLFNKEDEAMDKMDMTSGAGA